MTKAADPVDAPVASAAAVVKPATSLKVGDVVRVMGCDTAWMTVEDMADKAFVRCVWWNPGRCDFGRGTFPIEVLERRA